MSKKRVIIDIVVEDVTLESFMRHVLYRLGYTKHELRFTIAPCAQNGKQYVIKEYPKFVKTYQSKLYMNNYAAITATEADELTVRAHQSNLANELKAKNIPARTNNDMIIHIIPKMACRNLASAS